MSKKIVTTAMVDPKTPQDVEIVAEARPPEPDPTLGISVEVKREGRPKHRLVAIGDSLTHGFQSGAIFNTSLSYPLLIAREMGWDDQMRYPTYGGPGSGLPLNLEWLARRLESQFGKHISRWEFLPTLFALRKSLNEIEAYWETGEGTHLPMPGEINHNLAVYGWDLRNTLSRNAAICQEVIENNPPSNNWLRQTVENANERAALRVLNSARLPSGEALTPLEAAAALSAEGSTETGQGDGIETLIVAIGANNALGSVLRFEVKWTEEGYYDEMALNERYTVWRPIHFKAELDLVVGEVKKIRSRHVIWTTVPHVTIVPFARGVGDKVREGSRYYPYYTVPWLNSKTFNPNKHPHLTAQEARAVDSAIDQYNEFIAEAVKEARREGRDWYLLDMAGLLDRLASRRYIEDPEARPNWWTQYELPVALQTLDPVPDSRFFMCGPQGRISGGLFSLDGIHPTTLGYGLLAREFIRVMQLAGVKFYDRVSGKERSGAVDLDFQDLIVLDTLVSQPPHLVADVLSFLRWVDQNLSLIPRLLRANL